MIYDTNGYCDLDSRVEDRLMGEINHGFSEGLESTELEAQAPSCTARNTMTQNNLQNQAVTQNNEPQAVTAVVTNNLVPASTNQQTPSRTSSMAEGARRENANAKGTKRKLALDKG